MRRGAACAHLFRTLTTHPYPQPLDRSPHLLRAPLLRTGEALRQAPPALRADRREEGGVRAGAAERRLLQRLRAQAVARRRGGGGAALAAARGRAAGAHGARLALQRWRCSRALPPARDLRWAARWRLRKEVPEVQRRADAGFEDIDTLCTYMQMGKWVRAPYTYAGRGLVQGLWVLQPVPCHQ